MQQTAYELIETVHSSVAEFCEGALLADDLIFVLLKVL
jgi:hypothetical protein